MRHLFERTEILDTTFRYTMPWLQQKYNEYNTRFFGGTLPKNVQFNIDHDTGRAACAKCHTSTVDDGNPNAIKNGDTFVTNISINVSDYLNNITEKEAEQSLIHEMIHLWQYTSVPPSDWQNNGGHGTSFVNKMNEINNSSNGEFSISVTNNLGTQARHDNGTNQRSAYQQISDRRLLVMDDPHNENNRAIKQFRNETEMNNFINTYGKMHNINIVGVGKPHELDIYNQTFNNIKDSTQADNTGYYTMNKNAFDDALNLGAFTMENREA